MIGSEGIWPAYEVFYIEAMLSNTRSAVRSLKWISHVLDSVEQSRLEVVLKQIDANAMISELQNVILQAAALSRYFWPARPGHEGRAAHLRAALALEESSPLRNRALRNEIEHFDEKLDLYLADGPAGNIIPAYVGPLLVGGSVATHMFRAYYLDVGVFEMLGNRYNIQPIAAEIQRLHKLLLSFRHDGRLRRIP